MKDYYHCSVCRQDVSWDRVTYHKIVNHSQQTNHELIRVSDYEFETIAELEKTLVPELGADLSKDVALSLKHRVTDGSGDSLEDVFFNLGVEWAPVLICWRDWIMRYARYNPVLMMRDAIPLKVIPVASSWKEAWVNRLNCGIEDELSLDRSGMMADLAWEYIAQEGLNHPFTFVDGGAWGTIVQKLHELGLKFQPLFFYSHNPNIKGFLNDLGLDKKQGELLNDSLECSFPKLFHRPASFIRNEMGMVSPQLAHTEEGVARLGRASLRGVEKRAASIKHSGDPMIAVKYLLELSELARNSGLFTGILPRNSPTWSGGKKFLDGWPEELIWH